MTDVVIPLGTGSAWADNELRFCLRSLERYALDLGRVIVVGHKPKWLNTDAVTWLDVKDGRGHKDRKLLRKLLAAMDHVAGPFVRMSDDEILLRPTLLGSLPACGQQMVPSPNSPRKDWLKRRWQCQTWLRGHGYGTAHFDMHKPFLYDKEILLRLAREVPWQTEGFTIDTLYGNFARLAPVPLEGRRVRWVRAKHTQCHRTIFRAWSPVQVGFLNFNDRALTNPLKYSLAVRFSNRSVFETSDFTEKLDPYYWMNPGKQSARERAIPVESFDGPGRAARRERRQRNHAWLKSLGPARRRKLRERRAAV